MWLVIIYLLGIVIFTFLLTQSDEHDFLAFDNQKIQRFARALFVALIVLIFVMPSSWLFSSAAYNTQVPLMKIFDYLGVSALYFLGGIGVGFITFGIINLFKWIWK